MSWRAATVRGGRARAGSSRAASRARSAPLITARMASKEDVIADSPPTALMKRKCRKARREPIGTPNMSATHCAAKGYPAGTRATNASAPRAASRAAPPTPRNSASISVG
eukprot:scaffold19271_cov28-Tisochrysis_lutea.AAC.15